MWYLIVSIPDLCTLTYFDFQGFFFWWLTFILLRKIHGGLVVNLFKLNVIFKWYHERQLYYNTVPGQAAHTGLPVLIVCILSAVSQGSYVSGEFKFFKVRELSENFMLCQGKMNVV